MSDVIAKVKAMIAAPSCCAELKQAGQGYLDAAGTDREEAARAALLKEIDEDVMTIDDLIEFASSENGKQIFGEDGAAACVKKAQEVKAAGGKWCFCDACQNAVAIREALA